MTQNEMEEDIDEEGIVGDSYQGVETYYHRLEGIIATRHEATGECFLRIIGDDPVGYVEIRVPYTVMIANGWTPPAEFIADDDGESN